jgi:3-oxoacyl-[acyl-carrier-protein] synthase-1
MISTPIKRAVISGMGIISSLGNHQHAVLQSLKESRSGIKVDEDFRANGLRSQISGVIAINPADFIDRKHFRFMNQASAYAYLAMQQAIEDAKLTPAEIQDEETGLIVSTGGPATQDIHEAVDLFRNQGLRKVGPYRVTKGMCSSASSALATFFGIRGVNYSVTSACATSAHCIGNALEQIQLGKQQIVFAGGADAAHWSLALQFDAMGALSHKYNNQPELASRPFDKDRDGFVISGGAGILVIEEREHALARKAHIYAEISGYGATSDGADMVQPSGEGAQRCMQQALRQAGYPEIDYINAHGTSTPVGDKAELKAISKVFASRIPPISSTKSLSGHALGAAGVHEAIYSLLMMENGFISANANLAETDQEFEHFPIAKARQTCQLNHVLSNSFGFGGTNASLLFSRFPG